MEVDSRSSKESLELKHALSSFESYLERGKGFSIYNVEENDYEKIITLIGNSFGEDVRYIKLSAFDASIENDGRHPLVIYQDIKRDDLLKCVDELVNKVIYPNWFYNTSIIYVSKYEKKENSVHDISSTLIHEDYNQVINLLSLEQLETILELNNCQIHDINTISLFDEKVLYTPIELILRDKLIEKNITFEPQVKLGRFYVDFLITIKKRKIIVECDGRDYHSIEKDRERDKELSREGYQILRFTGTELFHDVNSCLDKIMLSSLRTKHQIHRLEQLNEEQMVAANHIEGPMRLLAPAGSGKTKTLINRISNLINQGVHPNEILALAFNKKASEEMEKRLLDLFGIFDVNVKTFHSFGNQIIKDKLKWRFDSKKEKTGTRDLLKSAVEKHVQLKRLRNKDPLEAYLEKLSKIKNELLPYDEFLVEDQDKVIDIKPVFDDYLDGMFRYNFYNFDDMLYLAARILLDDKVIRQRIQAKYKYILVDEFQDLNKVQLLILQIISLPDNNLFIVGDDDQMIYGFRGAEIRHILEFNHRYVINTDQVLKINYRSARDLVRQSKWLIDHNEARVYKDIKPNMKEQGDIQLYIGKNLKEQCERIANWIKSLKNSQNKWSNFAVLYRYNEYEINLYVELRNQGIPVVLNNKKAFNSSVGKTIFAYLRTIYKPNECSNDEFKRILNVPNQYLTNNFISTIKTWSDLKDLKSALPKIKTMNHERYTNFVKKLVSLNKNVNTYTASQVVASIVDGFGVRDHYLDLSKRNSEVDESSQGELVQILLTLSEQFTSVEELYNFWLAMCSSEKFDDQEEENKDFVTLNSIHKTKGNEFEHVALFNLSKSERQRLTEREMEEERRVAYVGVTRPMKSLMVTTQEGEISPFVREYFLNPELKESDDQSIIQQLNKLQTETNVMHSELLTYDDEIKELLEEYPEMNGDRFIIEKPFKRFKEFIRKKRLNNGLRKHDELQQQRTKLLNNIELKENDMKDFKNELMYRELLKEGSSIDQLDGLGENEFSIPQLTEKDNIQPDSAFEALPHDELYLTNESTKHLKVSEPFENNYTINQSAKTDSKRTNNIPKKNVKKERPINTGVRWTIHEEELLISRFKEGLSIKKIAELHGRNEGGISARLKKLGLK